MTIERRIFQSGKLEIRRANNDSGVITIRGYGAKFNSLSDPLGGFREQIAPGAFDGVLEDDVRSFFNHDMNCILGRTVSGTLRIASDDIGLAYEVDLPDTQVARDLIISMDRGDITQSSFAFCVAPNGDTWDENEDGVIVRTITKISRLYDVSPVSIPAYPDTSAATRSLDAWRDLKNDALKIQRKKELEHRARILRFAQI